MALLLALQSGTPSVTLALVGIPSGVRVGSAAAVAALAPKGIPSGAVVGVEKVLAALASVGIPSSVRVGNVTVAASLAQVGIPSSAVVGDITVTLGPVVINLTLNGIPSGAAVGNRRLGAALSPVGVPGGARIGNLSTTSALSPSSIPSGAKVGDASAAAALSGIGRIPSGVVVGDITLTTPLVLYPPGIQSGAQTGNVSITLVPVPVGGGGPPWLWLWARREKRKEEAEVPVIGAVEAVPPWIVLRTRWTQAAIDAVAAVLRSLLRVLTTDEAPVEQAPSLRATLSAVVARWLTAITPPAPKVEPEPPPVASKPWRTPADLVEALHGALQRKEEPPWRPPADLAEAIRAAATRTKPPVVIPGRRAGKVQLADVEQALRDIDTARKEQRRVVRSNYARIPQVIENRVASMVEAAHALLFAGLVGEAEEIAREFGYRRAQRGVLVEDAEPKALMRALAGLIGKKGAEARALRIRLNAQLVQAERAWLARFLETGDPQAKRILLSLSVDKDRAFADKMIGLRRLYLDDAVKRIMGEQDDLKARFLLKLVDWAEGKTEQLDIGAVVAELRESSARNAAFFARDQFSRFERSLTLASFEAAEAPYVEVFNSNDIKVRPSHRNAPVGWGRRIFTREAIVEDPRWNDYNCRCGFVPRFELTAEQKRRLVR